MEVPRGWRLLIDGCILAPRQGMVEAIPDGFERTSHPRRFAPILEPCEHRIKVTTKNGGCCGGSVYTKCDVIDQPVRLNICADCKSNPEWIKENGISRKVRG